MPCLPREVYFVIFNYLDYNTLTSCSIVFPDDVKIYLESIVLAVRRIPNYRPIRESEILDRISHLNNYKTLDLANIQILDDRWYKEGNHILVTEHMSQWWSKTYLHRIGGPAKEEWDQLGIKKYEAWYHMDRRHRSDGSAYTEYWSNGHIFSESWYDHGIFYYRGMYYPDGTRIVL
jgi:hypothetical protein